VNIFSLEEKENLPTVLLVTYFMLGSEKYHSASFSNKKRNEVFVLNGSEEMQGQKHSVAKTVVRGRNNFTEVHGFFGCSV
jgi:hypothetical protein